MHGIKLGILLELLLKFHQRLWKMVHLKQPVITVVAFYGHVPLNHDYGRKGTR